MQLVHDARDVRELHRVVPVEYILARVVAAGAVKLPKPLIAQPHLEQPFETLLDYPAFSLRMGHGDAPALPSRLSDVALTPRALHAMRRALAPAGRALEWRSALGGLAYNLTVLALCHRAVQLRGKLKAGGSCAPLARALLPLVGVDREGVRRRASRGAPPPWHTAALVNATARLEARRREHERAAHRAARAQSAESAAASSRLRRS